MGSADRGAGRPARGSREGRSEEERRDEEEEDDVDLGVAVGSD
jgi:hypothetical protein